MDHSLAYKKALLILATDGVDKHLAMCYLDIDKQLDECRAVSDSRLNSYLAQIEATKVALDKLAELQRKAKLADELLLILLKARDDIRYYVDDTVETIDIAIAKAKGE